MKKNPVIILNGFLGAGKTTLFGNLLNQSKKSNISICAVVNDMSELDVDGTLLGSNPLIEEDKKIMKSISCCVLSSKKGIKKLDFAINSFLNSKKPDLIIVETSGSCHPMPLIRYFKEHQKVMLTGVLVLIDSLLMAHDYKCGETLVPKMQDNMRLGRRDTTNLLVEQILFSSHIIITKSDRVNKDSLLQISNFIKKINSFASVHSVIYGRLKIESLLEIGEYNYFNVAQLFDELQPILDSEEDSDKPYDLATRVINDDRPFHPERLWNVCHQYLDKSINRSKGFFWLASRNKYALLWSQAAGDVGLEIVGTWRASIVEDENHGLLELEIDSLKKQLLKENKRFGDRHCSLTIIGNKNKVDQFTNKLKECFLTEEEIKVWQQEHKFKDPWPKKIVKIMNK
tara:strand:+ start:168 stop:1367 length:1200 start_codon:yes stop_codon:yes gene_type:complete